MATTSERYERATTYAHRAIESVSRSFWSHGPIDHYASALKTHTAQQDLEKIEARWWRASNEAERLLIARDAEYLADRIKENLPGAPLDWQRTNLGADEREQTSPPTSYGNELAHRAGEAWSWAGHAAHEATEGVGRIGAFLLIGGGLYVGAKVLDLIRARQGGRLLLSLEQAANRKGGSR